MKRAYAYAINEILKTCLILHELVNSRDPGDYIARVSG